MEGECECELVIFEAVVGFEKRLATSRSKSQRGIAIECLWIGRCEIEARAVG